VPRGGSMIKTPRAKKTPPQNKTPQKNKKHPPPHTPRQFERKIGKKKQKPISINLNELKINK
ncbi:hypothetical protein ACTHS8_10890, partial [Neisseria sp. P0016.S008]|uniref:hypothetical protein n=1 Tax=Neisseria sp. P0016.S008 TaxID=3436774 RepID=UPI003F7CE5B9